MNLHLINTVLCVSRCSNFAEAAYILNYTPAVVSKHVASMEKELGIKLFLRGNKSSSAELTEEGNAILPELVAISEAWESMKGTVALLKMQEGPLRIGSPHKRWNYGEENIINEYILSNPEGEIEHTHGSAAELLRRLGAGKLDGAFLVFQGDMENVECIRAFCAGHDCQVVTIGEIRDMYMAVSASFAENYPNGADFSAFEEFSIAFNSDREALAGGNNMEPFEALAKKHGFPLRAMFLDTNESGVYGLTGRMKLAVPSPLGEQSHPGVGYVHLNDWPGCVRCCFISMNKNPSPALKRFRATIAEYVKQPR